MVSLRRSIDVALGRENDDMGCLLAGFAGLFPRLALFMFWILRPARVDLAFSTWIFPLLGFIFLPFATLMYAVLYSAGGLSGWEWFWVALCALLDIGHWGSGVFGRRRRARVAA